jgi:hypothetical protein
VVREEEAAEAEVRAEEGAAAEVIRGSSRRNGDRAILILQ